MSVSFSAFNASKDPATQAEVSRTHERLKAAEEGTLPGQTVNNNQGNALLPAKLIETDRDELKRIEDLPAAAAAFGYDRPKGDQRLADYIDKRRKDAEYIDREKWIAARFDLSQPEKAAWFRGIMPSFLERRRRFGETKLAMQKHLFDITLYGPQSEEDLDFLFAIDTGKINMVELERPIWKAQAETDQAGYIAGLFARNRSLGAAWVANNQQGYGFAPDTQIGTDARAQWRRPGLGQYHNMQNTLSGAAQYQGLAGPVNL